MERDTTYPTFQISAVKYKDVAANSRVISASEVEYFLYVSVPAEIARCFELYQVDEIKDKAEFVCRKGLWDHEPGRRWYRFKSHMLNLESGYHIYRLSFVNTRTNDTLLLYFAYTLQTNDPKKPYDYMDKENRKCNCNG